MTDAQSHASGMLDEQLVNKVAGMLLEQQITFLNQFKAVNDKSEFRQTHLLGEITALVRKQDASTTALGGEIDRLVALVEEDQSTVKKLVGAVSDLGEWRDQFIVDMITRIDRIETEMASFRRSRDQSIDHRAELEISRQANHAALVAARQQLFDLKQQITELREVVLAHHRDERG